MKFSFVILGAIAFVGTASATAAPACNTACTKMKCFPIWCSQRGYAKTNYYTVTKTVSADGGEGGKATVTKTCTVTASGAGGKGGDVKTVTVTQAAEDDEPETVTKISTKTCTKTVTQTVTVNGGGY